VIAIFHNERWFYRDIEPFQSISPKTRWKMAFSLSGGRSTQHLRRIFSILRIFLFGRLGELLKYRVMSLLIRGARLVEEGRAPWRGDIAVEGDTIVALGELQGPADEVIDASGLYVAPGFIDIHSHTDALLLADPFAESKLLQGVTCEVIGNCGFSAAPLGEETLSGLEKELAPYGVPVSWRKLADFLSRLEAGGIGPNVATLVGHGNLRALAMGLEAKEASAEQIQAVGALARQAVAEGAFGLSFGLIYPPGCFSDTQELVAAAAAARGSFFSIHLRDEGAGLPAAVAEALEICRGSGTPLQLSHHKVTGRQNWGLVKESLQIIEQGRSQGLDITADVYPYTATNTSLSVVLPDWMKAGGREKLLARLKDEIALKKLQADWGRRATDPEVWEDYAVSRTFSPQYRPWQGKRIREICRATGEPPWRVIRDLLSADSAQTEMIRFCISEADLEEVLRRPWVMIGSDASAKDFRQDWGCPHPRGFGTFPRIIAEYVRKKGLLTLPEAIGKMTTLPAARLGLPDRGRLAPGYKADLVIFNFEEISDEADFSSPPRPPRGIFSVIVNGVVEVRQGVLQGEKKGRILRFFGD
jgi:N-acyl-D-amino-acid deacylase